MTSPDAETAHESSREPTGQRSRIERRPILKALSAGAALSLGSGVSTPVAAHSDTAEINPRYGFPTPDAGDVPESLAPDHEVELHRQLFDPNEPDTPSFFHFEPSGLHASPGDVVQFTFVDPNHTVTAYHPGHGWQRRVPEGTEPFSSPIVQEDGAWLYRFEREGLYDMYCDPHGALGMAMRVVVGDVAAEDLPDYADTYEAEPPLLPPLNPGSLEREFNQTNDQNENCEWPWLTDREVLDTDALDPMNVQETGEVSFETVAEELGAAFEPEEDH